MNGYFVPLACAVLGCGLMAGLFLAFSVCIMRALAQLPQDKAMAIMQSINVAILNPVFLVIFVGTALACAFLLVSSLLHWRDPGARYLCAGSACYLVGVLLVTMLFNVPMNEALASSDSTSAQSAPLWANYLAVWTAWNHVRTGAALAATLCFVLALHHSPRSSI